MMSEDSDTEQCEACGTGVEDPEELEKMLQEKKEDN